MSLFHKIRSLSFTPQPPFFNLTQIYGTMEPPVSFQVREISAQTIEDTVLELNPRFPYTIILQKWNNDHSKARIFVQRIVWDIEEIFKEFNSLYNAEELRKQLSFIQHQLADETQAVNFSHRIYEMVQMEINWLNNFIQSNPYLQEVNIVEQSLPQLLDEITVLANNVDKISTKIQQASEPLLQFRNNFQPLKDTTTDANQDRLIAKMHSLQSNYGSIVVDSVNELRDIINCFVGKRLPTLWNYQKQIETVGIPFANPLVLEEIGPQFQRMYESLLAILEILNLEIKSRVHHGRFDQLGPLFNKTFCNFVRFLKSTFFVYQQPPLVIPIKEDATKNGESIPVSTCLLAVPGINRKYRTTMYLINENHAKTLHRGGLDAMLKERVKPVQFEIESRQRVDDVYSTDLEITELEGAALTTRIAETNDKEEKYCVLFILQLELFSRPFTIWTTSLPVTVYSRGDQKNLGMFATLRDYATARMIRTPFEIPHPEYISWLELSQVILHFFRNYVGDETLWLTQTNFINLKRRAALALKKIEPDVIFTPDRIKWEHLWAKVFLRPKTPLLPAVEFSYFDWVYAAFKTIKLPKMLAMWKKGLVMGFIDKNSTEGNLFSEDYVSAESELMKGGGTVGTFLLRFSDNSPGAIAIVYFGEGGKVWHLTPSMYVDVENNGLANSIRTSNKLRYIHGFGKKTKNELLGDFYPTTVAGYVSMAVRVSDRVNKRCVIN